MAFYPIEQSKTDREMWYNEKLNIDTFIVCQHKNLGMIKEVHNYIQRIISLRLAELNA